MRTMRAINVPCRAARSDIFDWLDLRKNHGKEEARCRDLFYGLWINDLFMQVSPCCPTDMRYI